MARRRQNSGECADVYYNRLNSHLDSTHILCALLKMTHEPLIQKLGIFYHTLAALCYIDARDIHEPSTDVNIDAAREAGLSEDVIALIQRIPQLSDTLDWQSILPDGSLPVFYSDDGLDWSRRPTLQDEPEIPGSAFVLTNPNIYGTSLIYDTITQTLLPWKSFGKHADYDIGEISDPFASEDAKPVDDILDPWIKSLISLDWLPFDDRLVEEPDVAELSDAMNDADVLVQFQSQLVQRSLKEVYVNTGWNVETQDLESARENFDADEFISQKSDWKEKTQNVLDRAYEGMWSWQQVRNELGGELANSERASRLDGPLPDGQQPRQIEL